MKLDPVKIELFINDCMDCPFVDADESYTACDMKNGAKHLPVVKSDSQIITPPKDCPFRKLMMIEACTDCPWNCNPLPKDCEFWHVTKKVKS